jgi:hypothetical protein
MTITGKLTGHLAIGVHQLGMNGFYLLLGGSGCGLEAFPESL